MNIDYEEMEVADIKIDIIRKDIKNMHLAVYPPTGRVRLAAPLNTKDERLRLFAINKLGWIRKHMTLMQNQQREAPRKYINRESHYLFGQRYLLKLVSSNKRTIDVTKKHIKLQVPTDYSTKQKAELVKEWYRQCLKKEVPAILAKWETKMNVQSSDWSIRHMRTKWGSCNPDTKRILLNLELAKKPIECIEYVIVHELAHLLERNHNKQFISILDLHLPNWRHLRRVLNEVV